MHTATEFPIVETKNHNQTELSLTTNTDSNSQKSSALLEVEQR